MKLTGAQRLYGLGGVIFAAMVVASRSSTGTTPFLCGLVVAGIAYLLVLRELFRSGRFARRVVFACLALGFLWRIPFLALPPDSDDDVRRYVWDGRIQRYGYNPYNVIPADPAMAWLHTDETRGLNNPEVASPYPAGAQLFFRAVTAIHESVFSFKIAFLLCDLAIVVLLFELVRRNGEAEHWVLAYAWHPLLAVNVAGSGHVDILGVLLLLVSVAALGRRWRTVAAVAFGLAIAVKFLPIVLAPLYWRRVRIRDGVVAAVVFIALYAPFLQFGRIPSGSIGTYVQRFRFNDPVFATLEQVLRPQIVALLAALAGLAIATWLRSKPETFGGDRWAWPMAASLVCAPVVYPWYLIWLLPFLRTTGALPLMIWTVSILPTFVVWHLRTLGQEWKVPLWAVAVEYGSCAVAALAVFVRRRSSARGTFAEPPTAADAQISAPTKDE